MYNLVHTLRFPSLKNLLMFVLSLAHADFLALRLEVCHQPLEGRGFTPAIMLTSVV